MGEANYFLEGRMLLSSDLENSENWLKNICLPVILGGSMSRAEGVDSSSWQHGEVSELDDRGF
jgi:hypothetical protein